MAWKSIIYGGKACLPGTAREPTVAQPIKTCVSQQLSLQSRVNTQEQRRSKGPILILRLHRTQSRYSSPSSNRANKSTCGVSALSSQGNRRRKKKLDSLRTAAARALKTRTLQRRFRDRWVTSLVLILAWISKLLESVCIHFMWGKIELFFFLKPWSFTLINDKIQRVVKSWEKVQTRKRWPRTKNKQTKTIHSNRSENLLHKKTDLFHGKSLQLS